MRRVPFGPIEAFVAVARSGSLAQAASVMNLTVPALSRRIRLLEADLGVRLFDRLPRGLALTDAGRGYLAGLGPAWDAIAAATERVRGCGRRRTLRVSVMPTFAANWLIPRLPRFRARQHDIELEILTSPDIEDLHARSDLDCAIRLGTGAWPGLRSEAILPVDAFPVASPGLLQRGPSPATPGDLAVHALIETRHQPAFWREWFAAAGADAGRCQFLAFDNLQVVYEAAAAGMGIALGLDPVVRPYLLSGRLRNVLPGRFRLPRQFHLVHREGAPAAQGLAPFRRWLLAEARAFGAGPD